MPAEALKIKFAYKIHRFLSYWSSRRYRTFLDIHPTSRIGEGVHVYPEVEIGRYSYVNGPSTEIHSGSIGAFCSISWGVTIGPDEHSVSAASTHPFWYDNRFRNSVEDGTWTQPKRPPQIENDVWIGCNVTILRGSVIENGAIIGAGSVVNSHIPAYAIAAGSPAKVIKYRFDTSLCTVIGDSKWWEWPDDELSSCSHLFNDPKRLAEYINSRPFREPIIDL